MGDGRGSSSALWIEMQDVDFARNQRPHTPLQKECKVLEGQLLLGHVHIILTAWPAKSAFLPLKYIL